MNTSKLAPIPAILYKGSFALLAKGRSFLKNHPELSIEQALEQFKQQLENMLGTNYEDFIQALIHHLNLFPQEPEAGFESVEQYKTYLQSANKIFSTEYPIYLNEKADLSQKDSLSQMQNCRHILVECADGRNSLLTFLPKDELLNRFSIEWLPMAGAIIAPEPELSAQNLTNPEYYSELFQTQPQLKTQVFARFKMLYGPKIDQSIQEHKNGQIANLFIEFQAHFDRHNSHHGCGAHGSNLLNTQLETIKDCLLMQIWLSESYAQEFQAGFFKIFRTIHDTGPAKPVYSGSYIDNSLSSAERENYQSVFDYAAKYFESSVLIDSEHGIVRINQGNDFGLNEKEHDEQVICISNLHLAQQLLGHSAMEISWFENPQFVFNHLKVLLGIIEKNYGKAHPDKPFLVHFDLVKGNHLLAETYQGVQKLIAQDEQMQSSLSKNKVQILVSETDRQTLQTNFLTI